MLSSWHLTHLPVRVKGRARPWQVVDEVVVSWQDLVIDGFLLMPRPFRSPFVPSQSRIQVTAMGIEMQDRREVQWKSRRWRRQVLAEQKLFQNRPVVDETGRLYGRLKDVLFDESTFRITHLMVSRGILGDLLSGAFVVPAAEVLEIDGEAVKIYAPGAPFSMR